MTISNSGDLSGMQRVGRLVAEAHVWLATQVAPGITTGALDERGARFLKARGARVAILSNERSRAVKMILEKGKVEVTSSSPEFGEAHEPIPTDYSGPSLTICFNAQYVLDFLGVVESEIVALELKDEVSQAVMKPVGAQGYDYTYVIMPMRI